MKTTVHLEDRANPNRRAVAVTINADETGISLSIEGYGKLDGGSPVIVENFSGRVQIKVWGDISRDSPTHNINLDHARETRRKERLPNDD